MHLTLCRDSHSYGLGDHMMLKCQGTYKRKKMVRHRKKHIRSNAVHTLVSSKA